LPTGGGGDSEIENEVMWAKSGLQDSALDDVDLASFHAQEERALQFANAGPRSTVLRFESTLINLGHCHRKLRNYARARVCYHAALRLCPNSAHTLSCIGVAYHLDGEIEKAIDFYHSSLAITRGDSFTSDMLSRAIEHFSNDMSHRVVGDTIAANRFNSANGVDIERSFLNNNDVSMHNSLQLKWMMIDLNHTTIVQECV
jgi:tetratricopeptide (TPR) repeat protein